MVIARDPDFTKVTARERELLEKSDLEMKNGDYISEEDFWLRFSSIMKGSRILISPCHSRQGLTLERNLL